MFQQTALFASGTAHPLRLALRRLMALSRAASLLLCLAVASPWLHAQTINVK